MGILAGKRILVTGVITDASIAFHVARVAQAVGGFILVYRGKNERLEFGAKGDVVIVHGIRNARRMADAWIIWRDVAGCDRSDCAAN